MSVSKFPTAEAPSMSDSSQTRTIRARKSYAAKTGQTSRQATILAKAMFGEGPKFHEDENGWICHTSRHRGSARRLNAPITRSASYQSQCERDRGSDGVGGRQEHIGCDESGCGGSCGVHRILGRTDLPSHAP